MSVRSRREHKPTTKYLTYYSEVFSTSFNGNKKQTGFPDQENQYDNLNLSQTKPMASLIKRQTKICGRRRLITDEVEVLCEDNNTSPESLKKVSSNTETSPEIRKSSRKHKPNSKLQEYIQTSHCSYTPSVSPESCMSSTLKHTKEKKRTPLKLDYPEEDDIDDDNEISSKRLSIGIVDCFEGLTKDLAKTYPTTSMSLNDKSLVSQSENQSNCNSSKSSSSEEPLEFKKGIKRSFSDGSYNELIKHPRLKPSTVRNLIKTKKSTEQKGTKRYPVKSPSQPNLSKIHRKSSDSRLDKSSSSNHSAISPSSLKNSSLSKQTLKKRVTEDQCEDIKQTLRKFLIMGTKVANAISETLKHNEEALLSKSSAFEKKCLSLVHAIAKQGADLEEDDMEKVLKLLDEEQEERRAYRHTFLESLRVSHLTNMALYSQMLRLLKTL